MTLGSNKLNKGSLYVLPFKTSVEIYLKQIKISAEQILCQKVAYCPLVSTRWRYRRREQHYWWEENVYEWNGLLFFFVMHCCNCTIKIFKKHSKRKNQTHYNSNFNIFISVFFFFNNAVAPRSTVSKTCTKGLFFFLSCK